MSVVGLVGARLAGAGFGFLSQLVLARTFMPHDVGTAFLAMSIMGFVSLVATGGYHNIALTYLARFRAFGRTRLVEAFLASARRDMAVLCALFLLLAPVGFLLPLADGVAKAVLYGILGAIPLAAMRLNNAAANAQRRFTLSYLPDFLVRPTLLLAVLVVLMLTGTNSNIDIVLTALVVISLVVTIGQAVVLGPDNAFLKASPLPVRDLRRFYRSRAAAMLMVSIVAGATSDLVVLIGSVFLAPSDLAVLGVAVRVAALVGFFSAASQQFVLRDLARSMSRLSRTETDGLLWRTNIVAMSTMISTTILALVFGPYVLALFGPDYVAGYWPLVIFLLAQSVRIMGAMNGHLLSLGGHQVRSAALCAVAVVVLLASAALLTPLWGLLGLALSLLIAETVWAIGLAMLTQKLEGRRGDVFQGLATHKFFTAPR